LCITMCLQAYGVQDIGQCVHSLILNSGVLDKIPGVRAIGCARFSSQSISHEQHSFKQYAGLTRQWR
jgi:hypothetical protein